MPIREATPQQGKKRTLIDEVNTKNMIDADDIESSEKPIIEKRSKKVLSVVNDPPSDSRMLRVDLPSHCVSYAQKEVYYRTFEIIDLIAMVKATNESNLSAFIDVISRTLNVSARDLTIQDFYFLMYKLRIESFPSTPYEINWKSQYGNMNKIKISNSDLTIKEMPITEDEYQEWASEGFKLPTVRDLELLQLDNLQPEEQWVMQHASYFNYREELGDKFTVDQLIEYMNKKGIGKLEEKRTFAELTEHGVVDQINVVDKHFEPKAAAKYLRSHAEQQKIKLKALGLDKDESVGVLQNIAESEEEAALIEAAIKNGSTYKPREQRIDITINILSFFPSL